jgi:pimeloyl-ACP methyl ester carboxylesterase
VVTWLNASFEMRFRLIGGLTVRFAAASEDHSDHALLLSPWPESLLAFEPAWWRLAKRTHLVAVDLPGFGHSQRSDSLLTPQAMGEFIIAVADAFGLEHPHVVASSIGAAVPLQVGGMIRDIIEVPDLDGVPPRRPAAAGGRRAERHQPVLAARARPGRLPGLDGVGVDEQPRADLRVGQPVPGHRRDLGLLGGQLLAGIGGGLGGALADGFPGGGQLAPGPFGEGVHADV